MSLPCCNVVMKVLLKLLFHFFYKKKKKFFFKGKCRPWSHLLHTFVSYLLWLRPKMFSETLPFVLEVLETWYRPLFYQLFHLLAKKKKRQHPLSWMEPGLDEAKLTQMHARLSHLPLRCITSCSTLLLNKGTRPRGRRRNRFICITCELYSARYRRYNWCYSESRSTHFIPPFALFL